MTKNNFVSIDFETATFSRSSACAVAIVTVEDGKIVDRYYTLIQPPNNFYYWQCSAVHGLRASDTLDAPLFVDVYPEILKRLRGRTIIAHNASFDKSVLTACIADAQPDSNPLDLSIAWECTLKIYRAKGYKPCSLSDCCQALDIDLNHHHALSDAEACAELYLRS